MAQKPDGKAAKTERVAFTRPAAERISKAVRTVELGNRDCGPLTFGSSGGSGSSAKVFRVATFTGTWAINSTKTVTFRGVTSTPNTAAVQNVFVSLPSRGESNCAIAKDGTAWHLVSWSPVTASATVLTSVSLGTAGLQFGTMNILFAETVSTSVATVATTDCA